MTPEEQADCNARRGTAQDIINLVSIYNQLEVAAKGDLITKAAELLAEQRVRSQKTPEGKDLDAHDWLKSLARETYPSDDNAAQLLQMAFDYDERERIFGDGELSVVLTSSEDEGAQGAGLYEGYRSVKNNSAACPDIPSAASYFGFAKSKRNYAEYEYAETEEEWKDGIYRQYVVEFAGMVSLWRGRFFRALLSKA